MILQYGTLYRVCYFCGGCRESTLVLFLLIMLFWFVDFLACCCLCLIVWQLHLCYSLLLRLSSSSSSSSSLSSWSVIIMIITVTVWRRESALGRENNVKFSYGLKRSVQYSMVHHMIECAVCAKAAANPRSAEPRTPKATHCSTLFATRGTERPRKKALDIRGVYPIKIP